MTYQPLQKLILFENHEPEISYAAQAQRTEHRDGATLYIKVSRHYDDAEAGRWVSVRAERVQPYTDERWQDCKRWLKRRDVLEKEFEALKRGKAIPHFSQLQFAAD